MIVKRLLAALLLSPVALSGQTASTLELSGPASADGIRTARDGGILAAAGYNRDRIFHIALDGTVSVVASGLNGPVQAVDDEDGNLYVSTFNDGRLVRVSPDGVHTVLATGMDGPSGVVMGPDGAIYVADWGLAGSGGRRIHRVTRDGSQSVHAEGGGMNTVQAMAFDDAGALYVGAVQTGVVFRIPPGGGTPEPFASVPDTPGYDLAHMTYQDGALYLTHPAGQVVYAIDLESRQSRIAVGNGTGALSDGERDAIGFAALNGITSGPDGTTLYVGDTHAGRMVIRVVRVADHSLSAPTPLVFLSHGGSASLDLSFRATRPGAVDVPVRFACTTDHPSVDCELDRADAVLERDPGALRVTLKAQAPSPAAASLAPLILLGLLVAARTRPRGRGGMRPGASVRSVVAARPAGRARSGVAAPATAIAAAAMLIGVAGCGGSDSPAQPPSPADPDPYTASVTVTATNGLGWVEQVSLTAQVR